MLVLQHIFLCLTTPVCNFGCIEFEYCEGM